MAVYVYGIMRARDASRAVTAARTRQGSVPNAIEHDQVSALASDLPEGELRIGRENILGHADVLQAAFEYGPVLPMRLGTALPDAAAVVRELLAPRAEALARRLDAFADKAEMQVKATYAEQPLLRSILEQNPALRRAVDRTRGLPPAATHFDQIRIGEAIAGAVQARQAADSEALLNGLRPLALAVSVSPPSHERAVLNAAFLLDTGELSRFDAAVEQLSEERSPGIEFKLIGPLPTYSFVEGEWEAVGASGA
jgi:hypothetical protein